jgi:hypothetical protein
MNTKKAISNDITKRSMSSRETEGRSRGKDNKKQLIDLLEGLKEGYRDDTIRSVLSKLPPPPEGAETDTQEIFRILNSYLTIFTPKDFWDAIDALNLRPPKRDYMQTYGLFLIKRGDDLVGIDIQGQNTGNISGRGDDWQIEMVQPGSVKVFLKDKEPQSIDVKVGDIIKSMGDFIIIQNLSKTTATVTSSDTILV